MGVPDRAWRLRFVRGAAAMALAVIGICSPGTIGAQVATASGVVARPGELVRVRTAEWAYTGTLERMAGDTAVLRFGTDSALVPRSLVLGAHVQLGTRRSTTRIVLASLAGATIGMVVGAYTGVLLECGTSCGDDGDLDGIAGGLAGSAMGILVGGIGGGVWGAARRYPRWVPAVLP